MRDLMNQAQLANNTFYMVNEYFDLIALIRKCKKTLTSQTSLKGVTMVGPAFDNAHERLYFRQLFSDEQRYSQLVLNFLSNAIKFTPRGGQVSVHLIVLEVLDTIQ